MFFLMSVVWTNSFSQTITGNISFEGNNYFSDNELKASMMLKTDKPFSLSQLNSDLRSIREKYRDNGFLLSNIKLTELKYTSDSSIADMKILISEGEQIKIGRIDITGNKLISLEKITDVIETKTGDILNSNTLNTDLKEILDLYEKRGNLFTTAEIKSITLYDEEGSKKLNVEIQIKEENSVKISNIKITGNDDTKESVILREIKIEKNKTITRENLQDIKSRLERLNIFESVDEPKIYTIASKNETGLLINVKEGNTNTFDGILGYVPPANENETGYFTGLINVSFRNLFGTARRFEGRWQQETKSTQELEIKYGEPYFFGLPLNISTGFLQRIQDSSYTRRKIDAKGDILLSDKFTLSFTAGLDRVIPPEDSTYFFKVSDSRILFAGTEIRYDNRDNIYIPSKGFFYSASYTYGDKKIYSSLLSSTQESFALQRYSFQVDSYFSFFKRQSLLLRFFAGQMVSDRLEDADFFKVGGIKNIRGYREEQFRASRFVYGTIELRYSFSRKGFGALFFDPGYYYRPADDINKFPKQEGFIFGYGLGIRFETAIGVLGVSYAIAKDDGILDGKIHFGLVNEF